MISKETSRAEHEYMNKPPPPPPPPPPPINVLATAVLAVEFQELQQRDELPKSKPHTVLQNIIVKADNEQYYQNVSVVLGRILVCKPHSADCERVISLYSKIKSICSSSLKRQTMSDYLCINMNVPPLCSFDPRPATFQWMDELKEKTGQGTLQKRESKNGSAKKCQKCDFKKPKL